MMANERASVLTNETAGSFRLRKKMANERASVLKNETAGSVETLAVRSSSSRTSVNQGGIAGSFHAQNTSMLSAATSDLIFGDALAFNIVDPPRFRRVIELSRNVPRRAKTHSRKEMRRLPKWLRYLHNFLLSEIFVIRL